MDPKFNITAFLISYYVSNYRCQYGNIFTYLLKLSYFTNASIEITTDFPFYRSQVLWRRVCNQLQSLVVTSQQRILPHSEVATTAWWSTAARYQFSTTPTCHHHLWKPRAIYSKIKIARQYRHTSYLNIIVFLKKIKNITTIIARISRRTAVDVTISISATKLDCDYYQCLSFLLLSNLTHIEQLIFLTVTLRLSVMWFQNSDPKWKCLHILEDVLDEKTSHHVTP